MSGYIDSGKSLKNDDYPSLNSQRMQSSGPKQSWAKRPDNYTYFTSNASFFHQFLNRRQQDILLFHKDSGQPRDQVIINNTLLCGADEGSAFLLLVLVVSRPLNMEARNAIRETWGKDLKDKGAKLGFVLGFPTVDSLQRKLLQENSVHKDLIQGNFLDTYFNLSIKTLALLRWASLFCSKVKFVLKSDDDMFINSRALLKVVKTRNDTRTILGLLAHKWPPHRNKKSKWYVPPEIYPYEYYPDFLAGPAYLISGDATSLLYAARESTVFFYLEDVYITGILAEKAGVRRLGLLGLNNVRQTFKDVISQTAITSHGHSPRSLRNWWKLVLLKTMYSPKNNETIINTATITTLSIGLSNNKKLLTDLSKKK
ncbi:beta-1,3-galactosyltransferase 5-like [Limulus polyphemus]|uniref:Hexosyltransferase n=1 Tax=Limulus polyphemus TaxID=6850 RepID=A0ABM1TGI4_LIMPO|nr:beta-1,3-galactosyltransferase 5-like [Limulus polyphemus]